MISKTCSNYHRKNFDSYLDQRYYIGFPGYLTVLLASDFYFIFLCCGIALKIELSCKFPVEFCNLRWIRWTIHSTLCHESKLVNSLSLSLSLSLLNMSKSIRSSNYLNKLRLSIKKMVRNVVNKPRLLI